MLSKCVIVFLIVSFYETGLAIPDKFWQGNWFPGDPGAIDTNDAFGDAVLSNLESDGIENEKPDISDAKHGIKMGIPDPDCDDAQTRLYVDWTGSSLDYTCFIPKFKADLSIQPVQQCEHIPHKYVTQHICMNKTIRYPNAIPSFGNHRPLWPKYGEYKYVPKQRWLHNLEHGAIVMLYHPCADPKETTKLKQILRGCLWKHIITAFTELTEEWPIVLLSWGCRLLMNVVDDATVVDFIKTHAMNGPEEMYNQGQYKKGLIKLATVVTDLNDTILCPNN